MKPIPFVPRPVAWLSALLLYGFLGAWMMFVAVVLPRLFEIGEEWPRLAALGYLLLWTSPVPFVATGHHIVHALLDRADPGAKAARGLLPKLRLDSLWAGVYAWFVLIFASSVAQLFLLVLFPYPGESVRLADAIGQLVASFAWPSDTRALVGIHTVSWVVVAAQLYDLERVMRERATRAAT